MLRETPLNIGIIEDEAIDILKKDDLLITETLGGNKIYSNRIVLCLGSISGSLIKKENRYRLTPNEVYKNPLKNKNEFCLVGFGLTSIDVIRYLKKEGAEKIYIFSRNNLLPVPISNENRYIPKYFIWENISRELLKPEPKDKLSKLVDLFKYELKQLKDNEYSRSMSLLFQKKYDLYFDYILNKAYNSDMPIQDILFSTRLFFFDIWTLLSEKDKLEFKKRYSSIWNSWRYAFPIEIIEELSSLFKDGFIEIIDYYNVLKHDKGYTILLENERKNINNENIIDCTGGVIDLDKIDNLLIKNLFNKGVLLPHSFGGIKTNNFNYKIVNKENLEIYNLGPLVKGDFFSSNAFWFNNKCAKELSSIIINDIIK